MDNQQQLIPADYEQQVQALKQKNLPLVLYIGGVKTLALWTKNGYRPYVEVAERVRLLHQKIKDKEIVSYEMLASEPGEILGVAYWQVRICIKWVEAETGSLYVGSNRVHLSGAASGSADDKDCIANAETSALGRALGAAGLGTIDGLASYDEMRQAGFTSNSPETNVVEEVDSEIEKLRERYKAIGGKGDLTPLKKFLKITHNGAVILDKNMTPEHKAAIDKYLTSKEAGGSNG